MIGIRVSQGKADKAGDDFTTEDEAIPYFSPVSRLCSIKTLLNTGLVTFDTFTSKDNYLEIELPSSNATMNIIKIPHYQKFTPGILVEGLVDTRYSLHNESSGTDLAGDAVDFIYSDFVDGTYLHILVKNQTSSNKIFRARYYFFTEAI